MNLTRPLSKKTHLLIAGLALLSSIVLFCFYDRMEEYYAWRDPLSIRPAKRLWAIARGGRLEHDELEDVRTLLDWGTESSASLQRISRAVLGAVIEYPAQLNPPCRGPELAVDDGRTGDIARASAELRDFVRNSVWSRWANENWGVIEPWLKANVDRLQVHDGRDRFVVPLEHP